MKDKNITLQGKKMLKVTYRRERTTMVAVYEVRYEVVYESKNSTERLQNSYVHSLITLACQLKYKYITFISCFK